MRRLEISSIMDRIVDCGSTTIEFFHSKTNEFFTGYQYCNNRACLHPDCQTHRGKLHIKNHSGQMEYLEKYIQKPKAWIFTGWVLNGSVDQIREKAQQELIRLFALLDRYTKTPFVVYMEYKIKEDGSYYLHFHVVGGSFGDIHLIQSLWGRIVRYEYPITSSDMLYHYVQKYTAKTPNNLIMSNQVEYLQLTYKAQMCRYSVLKKIAEKEFPKEIGRSPIYLTELLFNELISKLKRSRSRSKHGDPKDYIPLLDRPQTEIQEHKDRGIPITVQVNKYPEGFIPWTPDPIDWSKTDYEDFDSKHESSNRKFVHTIEEVIEDGKTI